MILVFTFTGEKELFTCPDLHVPLAAGVEGSGICGDYLFLSL